MWFITLETSNNETDFHEKKNYFCVSAVREFVFFTTAEKEGKNHVCILGLKLALLSLSVNLSTIWLREMGLHNRLTIQYSQVWLIYGYTLFHLLKKPITRAWSRNFFNWHFDITISLRNDKCDWRIRIIYFDCVGYLSAVYLVPVVHHTMKQRQFEKRINR